MKPLVVGITCFVVCLSALVAVDATNETADKLCGQGVEMLKAGKAKEALALFGEALRADYRHRDATYYRALALYELKDYKQAERAFKELLLDYPEEMHAQALLGTIELQSGLTEQAKRRFLKVLAQYPDDVSTLINLGMAEYALGNRFAGEDFLTRALKLKPNDGNLATLVHNIQKQNRQFTATQEAEKRRRFLEKFNEAVNALGREWTRQYEQEYARLKEDDRKYLRDLQKELIIRDHDREREAIERFAPAPYYVPRYDPSTGRYSQ